MTARQLRLHQRLREEVPRLYPEVAKELSNLPLGYSVRIRIPHRFEDVSWAQDMWTPGFVATKTDRGIEYVEDGAFYRKGWTRPRPRLLPMKAA